MLNANEITDFPNHPFKIEDNEEMEKMIKSIEMIGVKEPILVRPKQNGGYEMIAGHRRNFATKKARLTEIPAIIREMTDEEATIIMVDSNIQREKILPSEKAFAYKMKMEAIKNQGQRNDLTSCQVGTKLRTDEKIAENSEDSARQIQRYIRLTELIKELLDMVDIQKIAFNPAVEISYLTKEEQYLLLDCIQRYDATPSQAQAIYLKKLSQEGKLTTDKLEEIMEREKPNQIPKMKLNADRLERVLPKTVKTQEQIEDFIIKCIEEHNKRQLNRNLGR